MVDGTGLLGAGIAHATAEHAAEATTTAAEELRKQILSIHTTTAATVLQPLLTILVVNLTLLAIGQNLVSVGQFLELLGSLGVIGVLVC